MVINGKTGARFLIVAMDSGLSSRINLFILDGAHDFRCTFNTGPGQNSRASPFGANSRRRAPRRLVCDRESARQHEVGRQLRWDHLRHPIAKARQVDACEQGFTAAQNDGRQRQVHLVDCSCE